MSTSRRLAFVSFAFIALAAAGPARAEWQEWQLSLGTGYRGLAIDGDRQMTVHAPGVFVGAWYGVDDYWQLGAALDAGLGLPVVSDGGPTPDPAFLGAARVEARYVLDIVEWVPHLSASVGALFDDVGDGARVDLIVGAGLGIDYRPARDWSVGLLGRFDAALTDPDGVGVGWQVALVYSLHFSD